MRCSGESCWSPGGLGVAWMRHRLPFQRSASVLPLLEFPTAVHADREVHDTLFRNPPPGSGKKLTRDWQNAYAAASGIGRSWSRSRHTPAACPAAGSALDGVVDNVGESWPEGLVGGRKKLQANQAVTVEIERGRNGRGH
jgi:hypothetical protein